MHRQFDVPLDEDFEAILGLTPQPGSEVGTRRVNIKIDETRRLVVMTDSPGQSVQVLVYENEHQVLRLTREAAVQLILSDTAPEFTFMFRSDDTVGRMAISLKPTLAIEDNVLFG
jgi:hypothetical protein